MHCMGFKSCPRYQFSREPKFGSLIFLWPNWAIQHPRNPMPFDKISADLSPGPMQRVTLDERFIATFLPDTTQDSIEAQELRQILHASLQTLNPREFRVVELRFQHKKSRSQVASQLGLDREELMKLETDALDKLRQPLREYMES